MTSKCKYSTNNQPLHLDSDYDMVYFEFHDVQAKSAKSVMICREGLTFWIPRSQVHFGAPHLCDNPKNWIGIPAWLAGKIGIPKAWLFDGWNLTGAEPYDEYHDYPMDWVDLLK